MEKSTSADSGIRGISSLCRVHWGFISPRIFESCRFCQRAFGTKASTWTSDSSFYISGGQHFKSTEPRQRLMGSDFFKSFLKMCLGCKSCIAGSFWGSKVHLFDWAEFPLCATPHGRPPWMMGEWRWFASPKTPKRVWADGPMGRWVNNPVESPGWTSPWCKRSCCACCETRPSGLMDMLQWCSMDKGTMYSFNVCWKSVWGGSLQSINSRQGPSHPRIIIRNMAVNQKTWP